MILPISRVVPGSPDVLGYVIFSGKYSEYDLLRSTRCTPAMLNGGTLSLHSSSSSSSVRRQYACVCPLSIMVTSYSISVSAGSSMTSQLPTNCAISLGWQLLTLIVSRHIPSLQFCFACGSFFNFPRIDSASLTTSPNYSSAVNFMSIFPCSVRFTTHSLYWSLKYTAFLTSFCGNVIVKVSSSAEFIFTHSVYNSASDMIFGDSSELLSGS